ncbi:MAG TPA: c-type cytochrome [Caulobacteraceae bacterium]|jgi:cytochrome c oxidase cbb3-type subunit 3|nr:c-type cytochrome [Caulobacteraceae bacterium]
MSSPCRTEAILAAATLAMLLSGCQKHPHSASYAPVAQSDAAPVVVSQLLPGGTPPTPEDPRGYIYDGNPTYIAQGKQYFSWYNCNGCHSNGGGGMGPAFMDKVWLYGGRIDQIHNSIAEGRPNGMPTWRAKIPDAQIWELAAYVRSLSVPSTTGEEPPSAPPPPVTPPPHPNAPGGATIPQK